MGILTKRNVPQEVTPNNNPVVYSMDYSTPSDSGFYWLADIYVNGTKELRLKKQAVYGNDIFFDFSRILANQLSYDFNPTLTGVTTTPNSIEDYQIYDGFYSTASGETISARTKKYIINASLNRDDFKSFLASDYIMGAVSPFTAVTSTTGGNFLTYHSTRTVGINDYGTLSFLNGNFYSQYSLPQFIFALVTYYTGAQRYYYLSNPYIGSTTDGQERCDVGIYPANLNDLAGLTGVTWQTYSDTLTITGVNNNGGNAQLVLSGNLDDIENSIGYEIVITNTTNYNGTHHILSVSGTGVVTIDTAFVGNDSGDADVITRKHISDVIDDTVSSYTVWSQYIGQRVSPLYTFNLKNKCNEGNRTPYQIAWINPLGGFEYFTFYGNSQKNITIEGDTYSKKLGGLDGTYNWSYDNQDFEEVKYTNTITTKYKLISDYINASEAVKLVELVESPIVFMTIDGGTNWMPINVLTDTIPAQTLADKLVSYEIEVQLAYKNRRQIR